MSSSPTVSTQQGLRRYMQPVLSRLPMRAFLVVCLAYFVADKMLGIEENFYVASHFIFGLCGPLFFGYVNPGIKNDSGKYHWRISWNPVCAVSWVLLMSFTNEVIDDPVANGIPFLQAWHHFAADMAGLAIFTVVAAFLLRRRRDIA